VNAISVVKRGMILDPDKDERRHLRRDAPAADWKRRNPKTLKPAVPRRGPEAGTITITLIFKNELDPNRCSVIGLVVLSHHA
jgi:hypothetical protein